MDFKNSEFGNSYIYRYPARKYDSGFTKNVVRFVFCFLPLIVIGSFSSCKKFVEIEPPKNQLSSTNIFNSDASATAALTGIYSRMVEGSGFSAGGANSLTLLCGLSSDEFINFSSEKDRIEFSNNSLTEANGAVNSFLWSEPYNYIYTANSIIEGLSKSIGVSMSVKRQLMSEAKFVRAFCYFYLTNLFGDVPLHTSVNYEQNASATRAPKESVYSQIIEDLLEAKQGLASDFSFSNGERVRPTRMAARALLSRVYLYKGEWQHAEEEATAVISDPLFALESDINNSFLKNSSEAIWQLYPVQPEVNTWEGQVFILTSAPTDVSLDSFLVSSFESGDLRLKAWVKDTVFDNQKYYYPFKYKIKSGLELFEYSTVLRLSEQFLIRAEARAQLNNFSGAQEDVNMIRGRCGIGNLSVSTREELLAGIEHERQVELFAEWGHRWMDLNRLKSRMGNKSRADDVLSVVKADWQATDALYPIPLSERLNNPKITQNNGY